ncbi:MAG: ATP-dependent endonuclease [Limnochordaceae bacterium]|nr:ATP-dependent endonuclease [Limnochordaceae bacterium]
MKLCRLQIHNYRSIRDVDVEVPDMLIMLGPNNHGKSNILRALEFGLSTSAKPEQDDFFSFRPENDSVLWVEMTFNDLTTSEQTTFRKYLRSDGTVRIRKTARLSEQDTVEISYNGYVQEPEQWWLKSSAVDRLSNREQVQLESEHVPELRVLLEEGGRITRQRVQEFQQQYIENHRSELTFCEALEDGPLLGQKNVAGGILPELFLIPAVRDLSDEIKVKTTTVFGRLLQRAVKEMGERDERFIELRDQLKNLIDELNARPQGPSEAVSELARLEASLDSELASWGVRVSIEVTPPGLDKVFELGTQVHLDDGLKTPAEKKGHGLQRAVIFALVRAWAKALRSTSEPEAMRPRQASESAFFAIEEPELFLHPHAQRQLFASLAEIAESRDHQVFIATHSTHFIDLERYRRIVIVTKPSAQDGTQVRQCTRELFAGDGAADRKHRFSMASWINPDRGELFFARKVILTEGETEKAVFPFLAQKLGCFDANVTVIDCGSKHNLPLYIEMLNAFRIQYCVVHDEDPLPNPIPDDWPSEKRDAKQRTFKLNEAIRSAIDAKLGSVEVLSPDFEGVSGVPKHPAERKGKPLAALDYFASLEPNQIPDRLVQAVRNAYQIERAEGAQL